MATVGSSSKTGGGSHSSHGIPIPKNPWDQPPPSSPARTASASAGPRLDSLSVNSSAYGTPRPLLYGTIRVAGQVIWSDGIRELETVTVTSTASNVNTDTQYEYYASFAFAIAEAEVNDLLRIWAGGDLIYDKTVDENQAGNVTIPNLEFKFYSGSEDQKIDPTMLAADTLLGRETPAYRGTSYIMFKNFPLNDYGNALPTIEVEVVVSPNDNWYEVLGTTFIGSTATFNAEWVAIDWDRSFAYFSNNGNSLNGTFIAKVDLRTGLNVLERDFNEIGIIGGLDALASEMIVTNHGDVICFGNGNTNDGAMFVLDGNTLSIKAKFGGGGGPGFSKTHWAWPNWLTISSCFDTDNRYDFLVAADTNFAQLGVMRLADGFDPVFVWSNSVNKTDFPSGTDGAEIHGVVHGKYSKDVAIAYVLTGGDYTSGAIADDIVLHKLIIDKTALNTTDPNAPFNDNSSGVTLTEIERFTPANWKAGETLSRGIAGFMYDEKHDALIICAVPDSDGGLPAFLSYDMNVYSYSGFWPIYGAVTWSVNALSQAAPVNVWHQSRLLGNTFGYINNGKAVKIDTSTGEVILDDGIAHWANNPDGTVAYDSLTDSNIGLYNPSAGNGPLLRTFFSRGDQATQDLNTIVSDLCLRAGLEVSDINTNDLDTVAVYGYAINQQSTSRQAIQVLSNVYLFDPYESDWTLNFKLQGQNPIRTINEDDLAVQDERTGDKIIETRQQEIELPEVYTINFLDNTNNYITTAQSVKRVSLPEPAMSSSNKFEVSPPIVMTPTLAKQQAEKLLYTSWVERDVYKYRLSWGQLDLDPSDVVVVNFDDGRVTQNRFTSLDVGDGFTIDAVGVSEQSGQFNSTVIADGGQGISKQKVSFFTAARSFIIDSPLLFDADDNGRLAGLTYILTGGYIEDEFTFTRTWYSPDNSNYVDLGKQAVGAGHGIPTTIMPDPPNNNPHAIDYESTLTVQMSDGSDLMSTVTETEMVNGANRAMMVRFDGQVEVIHFANVTLNTDGTYTLDTFLRGRRGTDTMTEDYTGAESFVLLIDETSISNAGLPLAELDREVYYKTVAAQQLYQNAGFIPLTSNLRTLMPYAPANPVAILDGSNNIDLTWDRRARIGADLVNGTGYVAIEEDTEEYELDIMDGPGTQATETFTSTAFLGWDGDTVIIDKKTYTFQTVLTNVDGNVLIGADEEESIQNLVWAINKETDAGKTAFYAGATTVHPTVSAATGVGTTMDVTAKKYGTFPNSFTLSTNITGASWGTSTMSGGADGTVVRAITGLLSPDYEYLNANIVTDFGSVPATISINIYQISAQVGRGFPKKETIDVQ